jgi:uncharacterized phage protein (TIGR02218 family)
MKRKFPSTLKAFLAGNTNWYEADCFLFQLPNGQTMNVTTGQWDITFRADTPGWGGPQTTFYSANFGQWSRGAITSEAGFSLAANTMDLTCMVDDSTLFPGLSINMLAAAHSHLFDGATVWVYTAYMPTDGYGNVSTGIETKFQGVIQRATKLSRGLIEFEVADPLFLLNMKVPGRVIQTNCSNQFTDANCGLNPADYTVNVTATSGSNAFEIFASMPQAAGYFTQGVVKCLSGANVGWSQTVKAHTSGLLTLMRPFVLPVSAGDTFAVIKGCDKTVSTCAGTTRANGTPEPNNFRTRFGGQPFTPPPTAAI